MTDKEMARLIAAERLIEGEITIKDAAEVLGISTRQVKRIKKKVRNGPVATVHGNRKRKDCPGMMIQLDASPYRKIGR